MKKMVFLVFLFVPFLTFCKGEKKDDNIIGHWTIYFPANDENQGYYFLENGDFYYVDYSRYNVINRYSGSKGKWKIKEKKVMIQIESDIIWDKSWVQDKKGFVFEGDDNFFHAIKREKINWEVIGDLRLLTPPVIYKDQGEQYSKPSNIMLKSIVAKTVVESQASYWRLQSGDKLSGDATLRMIIDMFNK